METEAQRIIREAREAGLAVETVRPGQWSWGMRMLREGRGGRLEYLSPTTGQPVALESLAELRDVPEP
jgi:hypothetical protein